MLLLERQISRQSLAYTLRAVQEELEIIQQVLLLLARFGSDTNQVLADAMSFMLILHLLVVHSY